MICQFNVMQRTLPIDHPHMAAYSRHVPHLQRLAERAPGFVWRFQDESDPVIETRLGPRVQGNLSVWESVDALYQFVFHPSHRAIMMARDHWFAHTGKPTAVMWSLSRKAPFPGLDQAIDRLQLLWNTGPSAMAFDFSWAQQQGWVPKDMQFMEPLVPIVAAPVISAED